MNMYKVIFPIINKYISDEALRDLWLSGQSPGISSVRRLMYLSVMLRALGPIESLNDVSRDLEYHAKGKPYSLIVRDHLEKLRSISL